MIPPGQSYVVPEKYEALFEESDDVAKLETSGLIRISRGARPATTRQVVLPTHLKPANPRMREYIQRMVESEPEEALKLVNFTAHMNRAGEPVDVAYMKNVYIPVLQAALYLEQHQRNRDWLVQAIQARIEEIRRMA